MEFYFNINMDPTYVRKYSTLMYFTLGWPSPILTNYGEHKTRLVVNLKIRHDLKYLGLVDLITTKQNKLPSFIDRWFLFIYNDLMFEFSCPCINYIE